MALIDDLQEQLKDAETLKAELRARRKALQKDEHSVWFHIEDLRCAIAALTPAPAPVEIEDSLAPEGMPDIAWETVTLTEAAPADEQDDASEFAESEDGLGSSLIAMGYGDDDTPTEHISTLTGDPSVEPESGLHGEIPAGFKRWHHRADVAEGYPADAGEKCEVLFGDGRRDVDYVEIFIWDGVELPLADQVVAYLPEPIAERPALNPSMQDEREEGYAPVVAVDEAELEAKARTAIRQEFAAELPHYSPTHPEADALARAHDYYSPEKIAERNKFNPWGGVAHLFGKPKVDA